ncbi:hypothetical protein D1007_10342 [Hordeum vulgare]|nr:hypothetical protein D1007_10342 [Hordeum vulgare]
MPQKGRRCGGSRVPTVPAAPRSTLEQSEVVNLEGLDKVRLIHALHLDPHSLVLVSAFAFLCEAFVSITPSVALLRHFFSLELISEVQCSGCVSLRTAEATAPRVLYAELLPEAEGFQRQWMQDEAAEAKALFQPPLVPATLNQGFECEELSDPRLVPVLTRLEKQRRAGVTMAMVVREFICRWIAPIQRHSRPVWAYTGPNFSIRTEVIPFSPNVLRELLHRLTSGNPEELPLNGLPQYSFKDPGALFAGMRLFHEWGLLSQGERHSLEASPPGVQPYEVLGRVVLPTIGVGGAPPPVLPTLCPCQAGIGGGDRSTVETAAPASKPRSRAAELPRCVTLTGRKRRFPEGGHPPTRGAPMRKKWMAIDE